MNRERSVLCRSCFKRRTWRGDAICNDCDETVDQHHALVAEQDEQRVSFEHYRSGGDL